MTPGEEESRATFVCDVGGITAPDLGTVEALARLEMSLRDLGWSIHLRYASSRLQELLDLCGLTETLPVCDESPLVDKGQPE